MKLKLRRVALHLGLALWFLAAPASAQEAGGGEWDPAVYLEEIEQAEAAAAIANRQAESSDAYREAWLESARHRQAARDMLRSWLRSDDAGDVGEDYLGAARRDLNLCHHNVVSALVNAGYCGLAEAAIAVFEADVEVMEPAAGGPSSTLSERVSQCQLPATDSDMASSTDGSDQGEGSRPSAPIEAAPEARTNRAGWILIGVGGASALAAFTWDRALSNELVEYDRISADCEVGACDFERAQELERPLATGRAGVATLLSVGVVTAVAGAIITLRRPERASDSVSIHAVPGRSLEIRF